MRRAALRAVAKIDFWLSVRFLASFEPIKPILVSVPPNFFPEFVIGGKYRFIPATEDHRPQLPLGLI